MSETKARLAVGRPRPAVTVSFALVAMVLAIWTASAHRQRLALQQEHRALARELEQLNATVERNKNSAQLEMRSESHWASDEDSRDVLRLRGELAVLRQQVGDLDKVQEENRQEHATAGRASQKLTNSQPATADYWPRDSWAFAGFATPADALQSSLWAANNGDLKMLAASVTGDMQKMLSGVLGGKSETQAAIEAVDEVSKFKSVRIIRREMVSADTALLTVAFEDRTETHTDKMLMKLVDNAWKIAGPPGKP
jgi:hypothetical protein